MPHILRDIYNTIKNKVSIPLEINWIRGSMTNTVTLGDSTMDSQVSEIYYLINTVNDTTERTMDIILEMRQGWGWG